MSNLKLTREEAHIGYKVIGLNNQAMTMPVIYENPWPGMLFSCTGEPEVFKNGFHSYVDLETVRGYYRGNTKCRFFKTKNYGRISMEAGQIAAEFMEIEKELDPVEIFLNEARMDCNSRSAIVSKNLYGIVRTVGYRATILVKGEDSYADASGGLSTITINNRGCRASVGENGVIVSRYKDAILSGGHAALLTWATSEITRQVMVGVDAKPDTFYYLDMDTCEVAELSKTAKGCVLKGVIREN
jgi:hypothetical protein